MNSNCWVKLFILKNVQTWNSRLTGQTGTWSSACLFNKTLKTYCVFRSQGFWCGNVAQVRECLPSIYKVLGLVPKTSQYKPSMMVQHVGGWGRRIISSSHPQLCIKSEGSLDYTPHTQKKKRKEKMNNASIHKMLCSHSKNPFLSPVFLSFGPTPEIILDAFFIPAVPSTSKYTHSINIQCVTVSFCYLLPPPLLPTGCTWNYCLFLYYWNIETFP